MRIYLSGKWETFAEEERFHAGLNRKEQYEASHIISLGERRANKIIKDARKDLIAHCRTHLVRSYPAGTRFTSSNYLPFYYWAVGIQLVSLNWQTYDLGTEINAAFFQRNGRSGYILKPDILRIKRDEEKDKESLSKNEKYVLEIEMLSAQQLPKPRIYDPSTNLFTEADEGKEENLKNDYLSINPFVEIGLLTPNILKENINNLKYRTSIVIGNGFNPTFENNKFKIPFNVPPDMLDLAFLRIEVLARIGSDDLSLGKYTVSLPVLMPGKLLPTLTLLYIGIISTLLLLPHSLSGLLIEGILYLGYRHIPLYDHLGQQYLFSSLFIYTQLHAVTN